MSRTEYAWAELTPEDREHYTAERKAAHAEIGQLAIRRSRINERIKLRTKDAETEAELASRILRSGEHHVACIVELDHYEGKVRLYRKDTRRHVKTRSMTAEERQGRLDFDTGPQARPEGSSGKVPEPGPTEPSDPPAEADPEVDAAQDNPDSVAAEIARVMRGPLDAAKGLVERFGVEGAQRVIADLRAGKTAEEAFAAEEARTKDAPPAAPKAKPKKGKKKPGDAAAADEANGVV